MPDVHAPLSLTLGSPGYSPIPRERTVQRPDGQHDPEQRTCGLLSQLMTLILTGYQTLAKHLAFQAKRPAVMVWAEFPSDTVFTACVGLLS